MKTALVDEIVRAVLYEGYVLYPYRPSVKNHQRWTFGGLYPQAYCLAHKSGDASGMQTECLLTGNGDTLLEAAVRFLHPMERAVGELAEPVDEWTEDVDPPFRRVESLQVDGQRYQAWQEATEEQIAPPPLRLEHLLEQPHREVFRFPFETQRELLRAADGPIVGMLLREQQALQIAIELSAMHLEADLHRLTVRIVNQTAIDDAGHTSRDEALLRSLVSTHTILHATNGQFVSLMDPPPPWREAAGDCRNVGIWPVLVGEDGEQDTMLSSPIILYDYPKVAPESPGDLFDCTEIDEILTLRIQSLTDEEKQEIAALDDRARAMLERTELLARGQLEGLHGTIRDLRPVEGGSP